MAAQVDPALYVDLIGVPYRIGARGPDEFDCYGLLAEMYRRVHEVRIPDFRSPQDFSAMHDLGAEQSQSWGQVKQRAGCGVLIRIGRFNSHVGFLIDDNRLIHCWEGSRGVVVERVDQWAHRITGFYHYE